MSKKNTLKTAQLTDAMYYILLSLVEERHGYAIMKFIEEISHGAVVVGPGTLYTLLKKLCGTDWIEQIPDDGERTKKYRLTEQGLQITQQEIKRRKYMVEEGILIMKENGYEE